MLVAAEMRASTVISPSSADSFHLLLLQETKQFYLQRRGELADLIEKKRSTLSCFKAALSLNVGAGKGSLLVAKQLAFEQSLGNSPAVDCHKWTFSPVNSGGESLGLPIPCRCRSRPQSGPGRLSSPLYVLLKRPLVSGGASPVFLQMILDSKALYSPVVPLELRNINRTAKDHLEFVNLNRLEEEVVRPQPDSFQGVLSSHPYR